MKQHLILIIIKMVNYNDITTAQIYHSNSRMRFYYLCCRKTSRGSASLSKSVTELEKEMGIHIFCRNNRGVYLSEDMKFLSYARQVVEQSDLLEQQYKERKQFAGCLRFLPSIMLL